MHQVPRPNEVELTRAVELDQLTRLEVTFPAAPANLTATEVTATLSALTYLHDLSLRQEHPEQLEAGIVEYGHPRHRLRTRPESALRVARLHYGSPFVIEIIVPVAAIVSLLTVLIQQVGGIVKELLQEHAETTREGMRQAGETEREGMRQAGETERERIRQVAESEREHVREGGRTATAVTSKLLPVPRQERLGPGGDNAIYAIKKVASSPPTIDDLAKAPQQMLRDIMVKSGHDQTDEVS